jgi:hypothetical protein
VPSLLQSKIINPVPLLMVPVSLFVLLAFHLSDSGNVQF